MEEYHLSLPKKVFSGKNAIQEILPIVKGKYKETVLFTDPGILHSGVVDLPISLLKEAGTKVEILDSLPSEPTYSQAQEIVDRFRRMHADFIVAIGGGSVMDIAKLASVAATEGYSIKDMLENPQLGKKNTDSLMIPTTAGTGSEATPNSIVAVPEKDLKVGIVNEEMIADYVILDGEMIRKLPSKIAASTGIDALCHAIECYTSRKANPFSNMFAMQSLKLIFNNLEKACVDPDAIEEKNNMLLAAFYGGAAITASGTTAVHALSYPLGGKYHIPHGIANAIMLLPVLRYNKKACEKELCEICDAVNGSTESGGPEKSDWVIERIEKMIHSLELPTSVAGFGIGAGDLDTLVSAGMEVTRLLVNNKRTVTSDDARKLYMEVLG